MILQGIIALPSETVLDELPDDVQATLRGLRMHRPPEWMVNCHAVDGRRPCLVTILSPHPTDPVSAIQGMLMEYGLDWKLIGLMDAFSDTVYLNPWDELSAYLDPEYQYDEDGKPIPGSGVNRTRVPLVWGGYHEWPEL